MSAAAAQRTALAAATLIALTGLAFVGSAGGSRANQRDREAPTPPANVQVVAATESSVSVSWDPAQDNVGVTGYTVYGDGARTRVASTGYTVQNADCGQSIAISVSAYDAANNRSDSASAIVSTAPCPDRQPPSAPSGFRQAATTQTSALVEWAPSTDNVGVVRYGVYRGAQMVGAPISPNAAVTGLSCGSSTQMQVDAVDAAGNRSSRSSFWVSAAECSDGQPPSTPTGLNVTSRDTTSVSLVWNPATDNVGVADYRVSIGSLPVATTSQPAATIGGLTCGTTYTFGVDASDAAGNRSSTATVSAATAACSTPPPPPPTSEWTVCATEGQLCTFTGSKDVRYGANGTYTAPRTFTAPVSCSNTVFGDPVPGVTKSCELRAASATTTPTPTPTPPPPPPTGGAALDDFGDFRNNVWTDTFLNRWRTPPASSWTRLGYTGEAWADGSGIFETSTPHGPGFRFLQGTSVPRSSGGGMQMADVDSIVDQQNYLGAVTDVSGMVMFPGSGNPTGFPAYGDWNALWEFSEGVSVFNQFGVDALANKLYVRTYNPATNGTRKAHAPSTLQYDRWYDFRWQIKWSRGTDGFVNFWVDGQQIASWTGANLPSSSQAPWLQWGWYGGNQAQKNEVVYAGLRKA